MEKDHTWNWQISNPDFLERTIRRCREKEIILPTVLAVYQAKIPVGPENGEEFYNYALEELLQGPGQTGLAQNQYIAFIFLPYPEHKNRFWYFRKVGMRHAMAISKVSLAVLGWKDGDVITDIRSTRSYRQRTCQALLTEALAQITGTR